MPGPPNEVPNGAENAQKNAKLVALGYKGTDLADIIAPGRTRGQQAEDLIALQRNAPKEP